MKTTIYCKVPTSYQVSSIHTLMGKFEQLGNGSLYAEYRFQTKKKARQWMKERNEYLFSKGAISESQYRDNKRNLKNKWPLIEYDSAICSIKD